MSKKDPDSSLNQNFEMGSDFKTSSVQSTQASQGLYHGINRKKDADNSNQSYELGNLDNQTNQSDVANQNMNFLWGGTSLNGNEEIPANDFEFGNLSSRTGAQREKQADDFDDKDKYKV